MCMNFSSREELQILLYFFHYILVKIAATVPSDYLLNSDIVCHRTSVSVAFGDGKAWLGIIETYLYLLR